MASQFETKGSIDWPIGANWAYGVLAGYVLFWTRSRIPHISAGRSVGSGAYMRSFGKCAQSAFSEGARLEPLFEPKTTHRVLGLKWHVMRAIYMGVYVLFCTGSEKAVG